MQGAPFCICVTLMFTKPCKFSLLVIILKQKINGGFTNECYRQANKKISYSKRTYARTARPAFGSYTQAVSKWERGGTPDAELLPDISQALGVSIDALFGREEQRLTASLARQICQMKNEDAYRYAFSICWAMKSDLCKIFLHLMIF